jgi:hypothetical protein
MAQNGKTEKGNKHSNSMMSINAYGKNSYEEESQ